MDDFGVPPFRKPPCKLDVMLLFAVAVTLMIAVGNVPILLVVFPLVC
jgi:hypothetical protein